MIDIPSPSCLATEFSCDSGASWATTIEELATAAATNRILVKDFMVILLVFLSILGIMSICVTSRRNAME
jgi:hypothetical protein